MKQKIFCIFSITFALIFMLLSCSTSTPSNEEEEPTPEIEIGVEGLEYLLSNDETFYAIKSIGTCNIKEITLPTEYQGKPVMSILWGAFEYSDIEKMIIPEGYTEIYGSAFERCTSLSYVALPNTLSVINSGAFFGCSSLEEIKIPNSVTLLGGNAFKSCTSLETLELSNNLVSFPTTAFDGTPVYANNTVLVDGVKYFYDYIVGVSKSDLPENLVINENTKTIPDRIFENCTALKKVTLPAGLKSIGKFAFQDCSNLREIIIPDSVNSIGADAFRNCRNLEEITVPDSVKFIGDSAFANTPKLKTEIYDYCVYIGNHLISLTWEADQKHHNSISVREGTVTVSLMETFFEGVNSFYFPASVEYISLRFMLNDYTLSSIVVHEDNKNYTTIDGVLYNKDVTELLLCPRRNGILQIPETVEKIKEESFIYTEYNFIIVIPKSVKTVEFDAFRYVTNENVKIFYHGTQEECPVITGLSVVKKYYFSELEPQESDASYWHYVDGVPTIWQ